MREYWKYALGGAAWALIAALVVGWFVLPEPFDCDDYRATDYGTGAVTRFYFDEDRDAASWLIGSDGTEDGCRVWAELPAGATPEEASEVIDAVLEEHPEWVVRGPVEDLDE